jgi:hypothetical protein
MVAWAHADWLDWRSCFLWAFCCRFWYVFAQNFTFEKKLGPGLTCGSVLKLMHRRALKSEVMILGIHQLTLSSMLFQLGILNLICLQGLGCETGMRFV